MQSTGSLSHLLFTDQFTVTVEEAAPTLVVQANGHSRQPIAFAGPTRNAGINLPLSLQPLQYGRADAKATSQFARINDPIAQMSKREPHGVLLRQLGCMCGAETDTTTEGGNIRAASSASDPNTEQEGLGERVSGSLGGPPEGAGPPESDTCLGAASQNHLTFTIAGGLMAITTKAALAAELKISKARVSQYVKAGMPVRSDGKLNREQALNWINRTQASQTYEDKGAVRARKLASDRPRALRPAPSREHSDERGFDPRWPDAYEINAGKCQDFPSGCVVMGVMSMVYRAPAIAAIFAVEVGADPALAYRLKQHVTLAMMMEAQEAMERLGVRPFYDGEELLWPSKHFLECNWLHLASKAGVPCDVEGWHAAMIEKNKAEAKGSA